MTTMKPEPSGGQSIQFNFLNEKSKKEPNITDVLSEIYLLQSQSLPSGEGPLATMDHLKTSRNINIPYTTARNRNIDYLIDFLLRVHSDMVKTIITFNFAFDEVKKSLEVVETVEYTVMPSEANLKILQNVRDARSLKNLLDFIGKFRIINLSKILKNSRNKTELSRIIKMELGRSLFTYKNFRIDRNRVEFAEDYCFHAQNYNKVKETVNFKKLKELIDANSELVMRRLKKFGILSPETNDYRDTKLEYILHVFLDDLGSGLQESDLIELKNFKSLRDCLLKVDTILDPTQTIGGDIVKLVRDLGVCTAGEITAALPEATAELLDKWNNPDNLAAGRVIDLPHDGQHYFIDGVRYMELLNDTSQMVLYNPDSLNLLTYPERQKTESKMEILTRAAKILLTHEEAALKTLGGTPKTLTKLREILADFEGRKVQQSAKKEMHKVESGKKPGRSFWGAVLGFFRVLFGGGKNREAEAVSSQGAARREMAPGTKRVAQKLTDRSDPVIPLSDYVELEPQNSAEIDRIITDLREHNLKVVVPIFNARDVLYPKRSKKLLISDVEYLLIDPEVTKHPDEIRTFTDSLAGYKIKDDIMPVKAVLMIEKYLLTVYRQKRAQQFKKEL